ncbi:MAG: DUF3365 domain-containing protein [Desulfamplus sp.]|nr:DUF3365 domain-containing protein [Desulfamplus sp.]
MKKETVAVIMFWLVVVGGSYFWNIIDDRIDNKRLAFETAKAFFQQVLITRSWNAMHGGVYVPVSKNVYPNSYLEDPLRDLSTDKNIDLTKINPAYMTRQIAEIASRNEYGIQFHITSLKPIRPENKPLEWEKKWLESFESDAKEQGDFFSDDSKDGFRYMAPLIVEESCLKCHAKQGYKKGDVRGGISVTLPHFSESINTTLLLGYGFAAWVGLVFIVIGSNLLDNKRILLVEANESLRSEIEEHHQTIRQLKELNEQVKQLSGIIPICMHCKEIRDDKGYWNQLEQFICTHSEVEFSHGICPKCLEKYYSKYYESTKTEQMIIKKQI